VVDRNPAGKMIVCERGSTGSCTSESVTKTEDTHDGETRARLERADTPLQETDHSDRVVAPAGGPHRRAELGQIVGFGRGNSVGEVEEHRRTPAASSCADWRAAAQSHQRPHVPRGRRLDSVLRASTVPVWFDRNGMKSGSQHAARLRGIARGRGRAADQRVRGEAGVEGETDFLFLGGRGHNGQDFKREHVCQRRCQILDSEQIRGCMAPGGHAVAASGSLTAQPPQ